MGPPWDHPSYSDQLCSCKGKPGLCASTLPTHMVSTNQFHAASAFPAHLRAEKGTGHSTVHARAQGPSCLPLSPSHLSPARQPPNSLQYLSTRVHFPVPAWSGHCLPMASPVSQLWSCTVQSVLPQQPESSQHKAHLNMLCPLPQPPQPLLL